ncbi:MAG: hypothetical protein Kow006_31900 [Gammaproteobacteria bacterium]
MANRLSPFSFLALILLVALEAGLGLLTVMADLPVSLFFPLSGGILAAAVWLAVRLYHQLQNGWVIPLQEIRMWALRMRGGNLNARLPELPDQPANELIHDINSLADEFQRLARDLDSEVNRHTERLALKTRSLQILYDVAASVNMARDLDELLTRFLYTLVDLVGARAGIVRLLDEDGYMELIAATGLAQEVLDREQTVPLDSCLCGQAANSSQLMVDCQGSSCRQFLGRTVLDGPSSTLIAVPLQYRGTTLGVYNLFLDSDNTPGEDLQELLTSIGRHLGMAIEKAQVDQKAQRLSIMQERTMLAHELHDSVAQTITSLRYRVRAMDELLDTGTPEAVRKELQQIRSTLEEAHTELRQLMLHYRAPMDERGLLPAIEDLLQRFRRETGITLFVQKDCGGSNLPAILEMQVLRIIQEALANVRKHSHAQTVRVLMRCVDGEYYRVLIEDDGVGFAGPTLEGHPGEHVGLSIMQERTQRLGGTLTIESEPGEGTRVELTFRHRKDDGPIIECNSDKSEVNDACSDH